MTTTNPTNRLLTAAALLLFVSALAGCAPFTVRSDYDPQATFTGLHTYEWSLRSKDLSAAPRDPRIDNDLTDSRVRRAVDAALAEKGYVLAKPAPPDFRVSYYIAIEPKLDVTAIPATYGYGLGWYGAPGYSDVYVDQYEQGTLFLDVIDPKTNAMVWRGSASARVTPDLTPEEREKRINDAVRAILAKFPPPAK
jgi:hypothetical protein